MNTPLLLNVGCTTLRFNYSQNDAALFLALGSAVAQVQALEFHLVQMLGMILSSENKSHKEITEEYFQKTLGSLATKLRGEVGNAELAATLEKVVHDRNYLIHGFLRAHQWPMESDVKYVEAINELEALANFFTDSSRTIASALRKAKDLKIFLIKTNPETGLPEVY